jgi:uncharacterized protein YprB with RNaseH-like and TPR domain
MSALAAKLERLRSQAGLARSVRAPHEPDIAAVVVRGAHATHPAAAEASPCLSPEGASNSPSGAQASHLPPLLHAATLPRSTGGVPESIRRMLGIRARALLPLPSRPPDRALPGAEIAPGLHYRELLFDWGDAPDSLDASFAKDFARVDRRDVLAFDTETTGLAGGTGTRAFMIGAADWVEAPMGAAVGAPVGAAQAAKLLPGHQVPAGDLREGFAACAAPTGSKVVLRLRVRQLYLTQLRGEAAMLEAFAGWLAPSTVLVSYNGRCYDAPLLDTRYRLARQRSPLPALRHLDLLFPTRRRYKGRWENCRLATIERHLLGIVREDDLPGSEAPRAWLDWLRGGDANDFRRVLAHNDQDLRSLVRLLLRLGEVDST